MNKILLNIVHPRRIFSHDCDNEHFVKYLISKGAKIGKNTRFISPGKCSIDPGRCDYITIGDNCCLSVVTILAHDYSWYTFLEAFNDVVPDPGGEVIIGNNCFIGYQACILKGTNIGDNVIIGARAVVKGNIPSNTVWAGCPAKQICSLEELYEKKAQLKLQSAIYRREHIRKTKGREPSIKEMGAFSLFFLERSKENYEQYIKPIEFNGIVGDEKLKRYFFETVPQFSTFEDFLKYQE